MIKGGWIIDTNILRYLVKRGGSFGRIQDQIPSAQRFVLTSSCWNEFENQVGPKSKPWRNIFEIIPSIKTGDDSIIDLAKNHDLVCLTNDRVLQKRLMSLNIIVYSMNIKTLRVRPLNE